MRAQLIGLERGVEREVHDSVARRLMEYVDVEYRAHRARAGLDEARPLRRNHSLGVRRAVLEAERVEAGFHVFEELALLRRRLGDEQRVVVGVAAVGYLYLAVAPHVREVVPPAA